MAKIGSKILMVSVCIDIFSRSSPIKKPSLPAQSDLLITDTDTMDVNHVQVTNFTYTGGDDCIALKPRSYNVTVTGATCNGGNGIPIGSIGEYLEDSNHEQMEVLCTKSELWNTQTAHAWHPDVPKSCQIRLSKL